MAERRSCRPSALVISLEHPDQRITMRQANVLYSAKWRVLTGVAGMSTAGQVLVNVATRPAVVRYPARMLRRPAAFGLSPAQIGARSCWPDNEPAFSTACLVSRQ